MSTMKLYTVCTNVINEPHLRTTVLSEIKTI